MKNRLLLALVSLAALSVAAPVYSQTTEQKATLERARKLYQETKYFDAINLLTSIYGAFEKSVDYQNLLAFSFYNNALSERPGTSLHELHLARTVDAAQSSLELQPRQVDILNLLGMAYFTQGKFGQAEKEFRTALPIDPKSASLHANIGKVCLEQRKWPEAQVALTEAVRLAPRNANYRNALGLSLFRQDKWSAAEPEFRKALALDSKQISHALNVGAALLNKERKPTRFRSFKRRVG